MSAALLVGIAVCWWTTGMCGFRYWWMYQHGPLDSDDRVASYFLGGVLGPVAWLAGYLIHRGGPA